MTVQTLPPKMTELFAKRAREGDYEFKLDSNLFVWFRGNNEVVLFGPDAPTGHVSKLTTRELEQKKKDYTEKGYGK